MKFYSLNKRSPSVDFKEAVIRGQAPDKGLYFPEHVPVLQTTFFETIREKGNGEIAFHVIRPYVAESIPDEVLYKIVEESINFPTPLVKVTNNVYSLELYHGPTLAFKDVGARFMSRCLGYFSNERKGKVIVLVATSGDTGGAVANGFYDVEGVEVVILYPSGKVSLVQEKQLSTLGKNIHALEVAGSFDDCQQMVKQAFADQELSRKLFLTSANSINVARWLPQQFYYFFAYKQWLEKRPPVISVPSGNFGNICAGILAHFSGLPARHFIAACNANDVVTRYFDTGRFEVKATIPTISNAMDVGNPSNFVRILELFDRHYGKLKSMLSSVSVTDSETRDTINRVFKDYHYLTDPHGAVGYLALEKYQAENKDAKGFFLETAHPIKFYDVVEPVIGTTVPAPSSIDQLLAGVKESIEIGADYENLKEFLVKFI